MRQSTVLVVDDEKEIADFIELYLKNENYILRMKIIMYINFTMERMPWRV